MIHVSNVYRDFTVKHRRKGTFGRFKDLLSPQYETKSAVQGISFDVAPGECVGYIGANGAGKSTTIKMLCGILEPSSGVIRANGMDPFRDRKKYCSSVGVVFGQRSQLWWDIPITDTFTLLRHMYNIEDSVYRSNIERLYEVLQLSEFENTPVRQLSLGQRMRADFACAMLHSPQIVYLTNQP